MDTQEYSLDQIKRLRGCETIWRKDGKDVIEHIWNPTHGHGADLCIDVVESVPDWNLIDKVKAVINLEKGSIKVVEASMNAVRRGGKVSFVGVYPYNYDNFKVGQIFDKGLRIQARQSPVHAIIDELLEYIKDGKVVPDDIITYRLSIK